MSSLYQAPTPIGTDYVAGAERVVAKLHSMGIAVPPAAVAMPQRSGPRLDFSLLEHAIMDHIDDPDVWQATALIHYQAPRAQWHILRVLIDDSEIQLDSVTLCPSLLDALGAVISASDGAALRLESCRREGDAVAITVGAQVAFRIEPIKLEPFNLALRDRVRTTFKGVRTGDFPAILSRASRLPGFSQIAFASRFNERGVGEGFFISSPANWALGMREALAQVGIAVKQAQAQELVAVFFGASSWHQLIKHQNDLHSELQPVAFTQITEIGVIERFYHTAEEAIFAFSDAIKYSQEPLIVNHLSRRGQHQVYIQATTPAEFEAQNARRESRLDWYAAPAYLACQDLESYSIAENAEDPQAMLAAAEQLLAALTTPSAPAALGGLYLRPEVFGVLESKFRRSGATVEYLGQVGQHAVAIFQPKAIDGSQGRARLGVYRIEGSRALNILDEALYKATIDYHYEVDGGTLAIEPDYGHQPTVLIPMVRPDQVRPLLDIARKHIFGRLSRLRPRADGSQLH